MYSCVQLLYAYNHQISKKDAGVYEVVLKDDRGKDTSTLNLTDQGKFTKVTQLIQHLGDFQ